jgi:hypothetical protein
MVNANRRPTALNINQQLSIETANTEIPIIKNDKIEETIEETNKSVDNLPNEPPADILLLNVENDNILNNIIGKMKDNGISMGENCLRITNSTNISSYTDITVSKNGTLYVQPISNTYMVGRNKLNNTVYPLVLSNDPQIMAENQLGVGISFELKNNKKENKSFGSISVVGNNVTSGKESSQLNINLINEGKTKEDIMTLNSKGVLRVTRVVESSDFRIKKNIKMTNLEDSYNKIKSLTMRDYEYKGGNITHCGVIAQELKEVIPNSVYVEKKDDINDFHSISTNEILFHLLAAFQYLDNKNL